MLLKHRVIKVFIALYNINICPKPFILKKIEFTYKMKKNEEKRGEGGGGSNKRYYYNLLGG